MIGGVGLCFYIKAHQERGNLSERQAEDFLSYIEDALSDAASFVYFTPKERKRFINDMIKKYSKLQTR